ncbi:MAG: thioesterase family protein [Burkholderiaceae bacterium]
MNSAADTPGRSFEPEFVEGLRALFERHITFNQLLGIHLVHLDGQRVEATLAMREDLIGHPTYNRLHGGVISASLDALGGLVVLAGVGARHMDETPQQRLARFAHLGTIDLRVDYLRPAIAPRFVVHAELVRLGSRVAATAMRFTNESNKLLATGNGTYIVA